jgi:hypothetical protein
LIGVTARVYAYVSDDWSESKNRPNNNGIIVNYAEENLGSVWTFEELRDGPIEIHSGYISGGPWDYPVGLSAWK